MTQPQPIHDPAHIKALAHPIRLALLDFLGSVPQATATQCAEAIKESVASCSFHLRTLAKHGYIEQADAPDAKSKPWRVLPANRSRSFEPDSPAKAAAISALTNAMISQLAVRVNEFITAAPTLPEEAINRALVTAQNLWLTDQEHEELMSVIEKALSTFHKRNEDPSLRPEGASHSRMFLVMTPELSAYESTTPEENS